MAKAFKIIANNGAVYEVNARQYHDVLPLVGRSDMAHYFLKNIEVSADEFIQACEAGIDTYIAKKSETHKQISVQHGVLTTSRVFVWVKK